MHIEYPPLDTAPEPTEPDICNPKVWGAEGTLTAALALPAPKSQDWCTPEWILTAVRVAFGVDQIDLDPCSNDGSIVHAKTEYKVPANNGLEDSWDFPTVYVNPPFSRSRMHRATRTFFEGSKAEWHALTKEQQAEYDTSDIGDWIERCAHAAKETQVIAVIPATPETEAWYTNIWARANGICFLNRRVKFLDPLTGKPAISKTGSEQSIPKPIAVVYWAGAADLEGFNRFKAAFEGLGHTVPVGPTLAKLEAYQKEFTSYIDAFEIKALDTRNASILVFSGPSTEDLDPTTLSRIREELRRKQLIPNSAMILVFPEGEVESKDVHQIHTIINRLQALLPEVDDSPG